MTGDPPIGTEDAFPKDDPDMTVDERSSRLSRDTTAQGAAPMTTATPMDATARADAIVRREEGVTDFANAPEADRTGSYQIEDYPSQDDPSNAAAMRRDDPADDSPADIAARGINDVVRTIESPLSDDDDARTDRRSRS